MNKKAFVLMADGFEDVEAVTPIDYLRRAGIEVTTVSISENCRQDDLTVTSRWGGIKLTADIAIKEFAAKEFAAQGCKNWDAVIVPGGIPGATNLAASKETRILLKEMAAAGKLICAICASPVVVLAPLGLIAGKKFTCYPGLEEKTADGSWSDDRVVVDDNIITSRGAGTAGEFSIAIIEKLLGKDAGKKIAETVLL
jgi:4-methyl-5(b-hydroxyethyl)-thiazole monophosphate biosynthesis